MITGTAVLTETAVVTAAAVVTGKAMMNAVEVVVLPTSDVSTNKS